MSDDKDSFIEPEAAHRALAQGAAGQLVDVREVFEVDAVRIEGALNLPLSRLRDLAGRLDHNRSIYLLCRSGSRAGSAAAVLKELGHRDILIVRGGLDAWVKAGNPIVRGFSRVWSLERQVRFTAGLMVFIGTLAGLFVHQGAFLLAGFVSVGLMFSAATDTCAMALVLAKLPWNRGSGDSCGS